MLGSLWMFVLVLLFVFVYFFFFHEDCDFYYVFIIINYARVLRMGLSSISVVPNGLIEFLDPRR